MEELFRINDSKTSKAEKVERLSVGKPASYLEGNIQDLFKSNLEEFLDIELIDFESTIFDERVSKKRTDVLGIDKNGTLCIIEFKRGPGDEAYTQIKVYRGMIEDNKGNFMYRFSKDKKIKIDETALDSPRLLIIATGYNDNTKYLAPRDKPNVELWTYHIYNKNLLCIDRVDGNKDKDSIQSKARKREKSVSFQERKSYSIKEDHLGGTNKQIEKLFYKLKKKILELKNVTEQVKKTYIAYKGSTNITDIVMQKKDFWIYLNIKSGKLDDPWKVARDFTKPRTYGHVGNGDYGVRVKNKSDLEKVFPLILQSYDINKAKIKAKKSKK